MIINVNMLVIQLCLTLCDPMNNRPLGSSVHGIFHTRIQEWVAICFSTQVSCIAGRLFTIWTTREVPLYAVLNEPAQVW